MIITDEERKFYHNIYKGIYGSNKKGALNKIKKDNIETLTHPRIFGFIMDYVDSLPDVEEKEVKEIETPAKIEKEKEVKEIETPAKIEKEEEVVKSEPTEEVLEVIEDTKLQELEKELEDAIHANSINNMPSTKKALTTAKSRLSKYKNSLTKEKDEY